MEFKTAGKKGSLTIGLVAAIALLIISIIGVRVWYNHNLSPVSSASAPAYFMVDSGTSVHLIARDLHQAGLIRSPQAFETFVISNNYLNKLQAGTYNLSPSMS